MPEEIEHKEFVTGFRGYEREEVRAFLRAVATELRALNSGRATGLASLESLNSQLGMVVHSAADYARALQKAERDAALVLRRAEAEADDVRAGAESEARQIVADAERRAADVRMMVEQITTQRLKEVSHKLDELRSFQNRMRKRFSFVETALELVREGLQTEALEPHDPTEETTELPISAQRYLADTSREPE